MPVQRNDSSSVPLQSRRLAHTLSSTPIDVAANTTAACSTKVKRRANHSAQTSTPSKPTELLKVSPGATDHSVESINQMTNPPSSAATGDLTAVSS